MSKRRGPAEPGPDLTGGSPIQVKRKSIIVLGVGACALVLGIGWVHRLHTTQSNAQLLTRFMSVKTAVDTYAPLERDRVLTCLAAHGFDVDAPLTAQSTRSADSLADLPDPLTRADAAQRGYSPVDVIADPLPTALESLPEPERSAAQIALDGDDQSPRQSVIVDGTPVSASNEGCVASARADIYGSVQNFLSLAYGTMPAQIASQSAENDSSYLAAVEAWAACMDDRGYDYDTPGDARSDALARPREAELGVATDDADCRHRSHVDDAYATAADEAVRRWVLAHRDDVDDQYALLLSIDERMP